MKYLITEVQYLLFENKKQAKQLFSNLKNKYPNFTTEIDILFDKVLDTDPSSNNKYMGRIVKLVIDIIKGNEEKMFSNDKVNSKAFFNMTLRNINYIKEHLSSFHHFAEMANPPERFVYN